MAVAASMAIIFAVLALQENDKAIAASKSTAVIGAINARYMGLVWLWGAVVLASTYTLVLEWKEWWQFLGASAAFAGLCLFFSTLLNKEPDADNEDTTLLKLSRNLAKVQLAGMIIAMVGLLIDGKMIRYQNPRYTDWAANNVFFFGALALAIISYIAIRSHKKISD